MLMGLQTVQSVNASVITGEQLKGCRREHTSQVEKHRDEAVVMLLLCCYGEPLRVGASLH